jgi:hypothetical protein
VGSGSLCHETARTNLQHVKQEAADRRVFRKMQFAMKHAGGKAIEDKRNKGHKQSHSCLLHRSQLFASVAQKSHF